MNDLQHTRCSAVCSAWRGARSLAHAPLELAVGLSIADVDRRPVKYLHSACERGEGDTRRRERHER